MLIICVLRVPLQATWWSTPWAVRPSPPSLMSMNLELQRNHHARKSHLVFSMWFLGSKMGHLWWLLLHLRDPTQRLEWESLAMLPKLRWSSGALASVQCKHKHERPAKGPRTMASLGFGNERRMGTWSGLKSGRSYQLRIVHQHSSIMKYFLQQEYAFKNCQNQWKKHVGNECWNWWFGRISILEPAFEPSPRSFWLSKKQTATSQKRSVMKWIKDALTLF